MSGVELKNVVKQFGDVVVVKELNLAIAEGEFLVLLGESGCGKSTTLRMIAGLEEVTAGRISIAGRDVTDTHPMDRDIAMVFQNYALYPHMDVAKNMSFSLRISGVAQDVIEQRVAAAAKILNIEHILARKPKELSGGQRQRVAIGRAIVREPKVFLFDEPLSNLDAKLRGHMRAELAVLHERLGKTTIYVTHDQVEAMTLATRIVVFDKGTIQQVGTPTEVFNDPANLFVAGFIGTPSMNLFEVTAKVRDGSVRFAGSGIDWASPAWLKQTSVKDGQAITLGLRPQSIAVGNQQANQFSLRTDVVEYLGTESQVVGSMPANDSRRVSAMVPKDARAMLHQTVDFCFDPNALHVFDTASGASFRPTAQDTH